MAKRGPSSKSAAFEYFTISSDGKFYLCQCRIGENDDDEICNAKISAYTGNDSKSAPTRAGNLKRHLQRLHPEVHTKVSEKDLQDKPPGKKIANFNQQQPSTSRITEHFVSNKVTVTMTHQQFKNSIIDMVVKHSLPLYFFNKAAFISMNGEMAKKLGVCLERRSVRNYVLTKAAEEKERLRILLKDRFVFLKMDACTRHRVNYFAIDARFVNDDGEPCTQTLAVRDTHANHTSEFMQKLVEQVMAEFGIDKDQVLIIVTDNASNMVSMMERIIAKRDLGEDDDPDDDPNTFVIDDQTDEEMNELTQIIDAAYFPIQHMRCAVHTLQLAIRDGLKNQHESTFIAKVRKVATAARTPKIDAILKRRAGKGAIIDQATRWGSTYLMVERLLELKSYIQDLANEDLTLRDNQWDELLELKATLLFPYCVTKKLQSEHLTPATFFKEWKGLVFQLSNRGGLIAEGIVQSMKRRETVLLSCPLILAGIYVDPNTRLLLTPEKKEEARQQMMQMATRLYTRREESQRINECLSVSDGPSTSYSSTTINLAIDSGAKDFEDFLDQIEDRPTQQNVLPHQSEIEKRRKNFEDGLKGLESINRSMKLSFEEALALYNEDVAIVARLVSAMPTTQVSVERLFSSLRIIKSDLRASMKEDLIEAILFLRVRD